MTRLTALAVLLLLPSLLLPGCSPASEADSVADAESMDAASISLYEVRVRISYAGGLEGRLSAALFLDDPPAGPHLALQTVAEPSFPEELQLRDIEAGDYYVTAMLDLPPANPTIPGSEDLLASMPLRVGDDMPDLVELAIEE